jgi:pimeloyl-ACP methyl ester carboxylesterase
MASTDALAAPSGHHGRPERIRIDGLEMNVLQYGSGPAVVLGHSYLWDARMWQPQVEALARRYRVIVPELWGHGESGALPTGTTTMQDLARHHLAVLDHLGVQRCAVIGLSVGGMWGAELALMAPERVSALVLMDTSLAAEPDHTRERYFALLKDIEVRGHLADAVRNAVVPMFFSPEVGTRHPELPSRMDASLQAWDQERLLDSIVPLGRVIFGRREAAAELAAIKAPSLVMTGARDIPRPPTEGRLMAERMNCRFIEIPEAGHISNLEAASFVTAALEEFLANPG